MMDGGTRMEDNNLQIVVLPANVAALAGVTVVAALAGVAEVELWRFVDGVLLAGRER